MKDCNFCLDNNSLEGDIWFEDDLFYVVSSRDSYPRHAGMIIPKRHIKTPFEFTDEEWMRLKSVILETKQLVSQHKPEGFNLGWNVGEIGGQHVPHVHLHVMPRFADDPLAGKGIRSAFKVQ